MNFTRVSFFISLPSAFWALVVVSTISVPSKTHSGVNTMDIVERAKNIIMTPKTEWLVIAAEEPNTAQILKGYVLPLALIQAIAYAIGLGVIGRGMTTSFSWGIAMGLIQFI